MDFPRFHGLKIHHLNVLRLIDKDGHIAYFLKENPFNVLTLPETRLKAKVSDNEIIFLYILYRGMIGMVVLGEEKPLLVFVRACLVVGDLIYMKYSTIAHWRPLCTQIFGNVQRSVLCLNLGKKQIQITTDQ